MDIQEPVGLIHDTIFYNVVFFCRKKIFAHPVDLNFYQQKVYLSHYDDLRSSANPPDPPDSLFPFFYYDGFHCCPATAYLNTHCDLFNFSLDRFYSALLDKTTFRKFIMTYYFGNYFNNEDLQKLCLATGEMVARALAILSETFAVQYFMDMLLHFNQLVDEMVAYCKRLIPFISAYRAPHNPETLNVLEKFISSDNQPLVRKRLMDPREADIIPLENQTYSVCHINQCIIKYLSQNGNYLYILGCDCHVFLSRLLHYRHVTMQSIVTSLGHPVKVEIINALRDKELTVSQLARRLQLARPSISRYIDDLLDELVIIQSRKSGPEIYYRLNGTYFQNAKKTITRYLDETIVDVDRLL